MLRTLLSKPVLIVASLTGALVLTFAAGAGAGFYLSPQAAQHDDHDGHEDHDDHGHEDLVGLSWQAFRNLRLKMGSVARGDYWDSVLVPARVVEIPGRSDLSISAPVAGVVERIHVLPGETLDFGDGLFLLRITDEGLIGAQSNLLKTLSQQEVAQQEITRLKPLIESGAVSGKRKRELEYELQQLDSEQAALLQELRGRGLPDSAVDSVLKEKTLVVALPVALPDFTQEFGAAAKSSGGFSIETMKVYPGKTVERGEDLCSLAYHAELYIEGTAFESDLPTLQRIAENQWPLTAELEFAEHDHNAAVLENLRLLRIDNHLDEASQTIRFFVSLKNHVERTQKDDAGRVFQQWRFRPGQRLHLRLPSEKWTNQLTLPVEAVVVDGPNAFIFAKHIEDPNADHSGHEHAFLELEPLPVHLLHRDGRTAVIADDQVFANDRRVALNAAQYLYLAWKSKTEGGGGHHHDH